MLEHPTTRSWSLSPSQAEHVDRVCGAFEAAWRAVAAGGERPPIERYLADAPEPVRLVLLDELLELEIAYRQRLGEKPALKEYYPRFPDFFKEMTLAEAEAEPAGLAEAPPAQPSQEAPSWTWDAGDAAPPTESPPARPPHEPGAAGWPVLPGYEVMQELGRGGMGVVYKARQKGLNRIVALKMIRDAALAGPEQLARFRIEAEAVARLRHPNIVPIYEIGEHHARPFFSMEFAEGGSLGQKLAGRPLPFAEAADLAATLARAVHHAHRRNVIHRDLKPANVLLAGDGRAMLTDFGLAKLLDGDAGWTLSGAVMGTASYMAPEQAAGKTREVGPPADVYALGAILYELLTGRPPFRGETPLETLDQIRFQVPVPPSHWTPDVPAGLEAICLKCLGKKPHQRYASAEGLAFALQEFVRPAARPS